VQFGQEGLVLRGHRRRIEAGADKADPNDLASLLRAGRERPRRRTAEQRYEIASSHVGHGGLLPRLMPTPGATQHGEPGVFVAFEETAKELAQNVRSLGVRS